MAMPSNPEWSQRGTPVPDSPRRRWTNRGSSDDDDREKSDDPGDGDDHEDDDRDDDATESLQDGDSRRVERWSWTFALAVLLVAAGLATTEPALVAAALVPLLVVGAAGLTSLPPVSLSVERSIDFDPTAPGEPVEVELTVHNDGGAALSDVRVVDGVPDEPPVRDGSPRGAFSLEAGESHTIRYTIGARRGTHAFDGVRIRVRNALGTALAEDRRDAEGDREVECDLPLRDVPIADHATRGVGGVTADEAGEGLEFYSVREYRRGDAVSDVDWRRYARTGELTTVRYREERAATVMLAVEARDEAYVAASPEMPSAADLSAYAAEHAFAALVRSHHDVGLAALFQGSIDVVEPGDRVETLAEARDLLERVTDRNPIGRVTSPEAALGEASSALVDLERELPGRAQVVLFTPATDRYAEQLARGLLAHGFPVTLVVPLVATVDAPEQRVVAVEQRERLTALRGAGAHVVEWDREEPLPLVLERAMQWGGRS